MTIDLSSVVLIFVSASKLHCSLVLCIGLRTIHVVVTSRIYRVFDRFLLQLMLKVASFWGYQFEIYVDGIILFRTNLRVFLEVGGLLIRS